MSWDEAIKEAYATPDSKVITLAALELRHRRFMDEMGRPTQVRVVQAFRDYWLTLEPGAPANGGESVEFRGVGFAMVPPGQEENQTPTIQIRVPTVSQEVVRYMEQAIADLDPITCILRMYVSSDLTRPQMVPPWMFTLSNVTVDSFQMTGSCNLQDVHNFPFPANVYSVFPFKGLA